MSPHKPKEKLWPADVAVEGAVAAHEINPRASSTVVKLRTIMKHLAQTAKRSV
jgi:hypothetical protein